MSLLVVTPDERVARWAAQPVHLGGPHWFTPYVLGPSGVPDVKDDAQARDNPELAVLSAMAHGRDADPARAIEVALAALKASIGLDADRADLYADLIINSLSEAARQALKKMDVHKYEFQSEWAREQIAQGEVRGRVALLLRMLTVRFGGVEAPLKERIQRASIAELEAIGERLLTARTLTEALGPV